jgi:DNA helicase II / ATP-dependent DNA helicase PcrA
VSADTSAPLLTATQRRVLERVDNPFITTREQAAAVKHDGDFFLSACPGAGKTRTVGLRLAYHAAFHPDISVAATSHTNTAIEAIQTAARELTSLPDHYWVGTLHSFLLRYVVYPFGALYMGCSELPQVAAEDRDWPDDIPDVAAHDDYPGCRVKAWKFDAHPGPRFTYQRPADWPPALTEDINVAGLTEWARAIKRDYWKRGLLSFSDVLWVAYRVLERHPELAKAVAARFDEIVVDEVQDASELQLKCIELLRAQKTHPRLVIVGDLCQAVYEWSGATPAGLRQFAADQHLGELPLTANFRSSKLICGVTHRFSTRARPDRAAGANTDAAEQPELWRWKRNSSPCWLKASGSALQSSVSPKRSRPYSRGRTRSSTVSTDARGATGLLAVGCCTYSARLPSNATNAGDPRATPSAHWTEPSPTSPSGQADPRT